MDGFSADIAALEPGRAEDDGKTIVKGRQSIVDLQPEIRPHSSDEQLARNVLDLVVFLETVKLHLFDEQATGESNLGECGIASFSLNSTTLRAKLLSDNAKEVELVLKSFTIKNNRPGNSKFREIIPAAGHDRNQFMVLYTTSGLDPAGLAVITVDAPQVILAIEPVIGLLSFFINPNPSSSDLTSQTVDETLKTQSDSDAVTETPAGYSINARFDLHDVSISILEDDTNPDSQAIRLSIQHVLISQQVRMDSLVFEIVLTIFYRAFWRSQSTTSACRYHGWVKTRRVFVFWTMWTSRFLWIVARHCRNGLPAWRSLFNPSCSELPTEIST